MASLSTSCFQIRWGEGWAFGLEGKALLDMPVSGAPGLTSCCSLFLNLATLLTHMLVATGDGEIPWVPASYVGDSYEFSVPRCDLVQSQLL